MDLDKVDINELNSILLAGNLFSDKKYHYDIFESIKNLSGVWAYQCHDLRNIEFRMKRFFENRDEKDYEYEASLVKSFHNADTVSEKEEVAKKFAAVFEGFYIREHLNTEMLHTVPKLISNLLFGNDDFETGDSIEDADAKWSILCYHVFNAIISETDKEFSCNYHDVLDYLNNRLSDKNKWNSSLLMTKVSILGSDEIHIISWLNALYRISMLRTRSVFDSSEERTFYDTISFTSFEEYIYETLKYGNSYSHRNTNNDTVVFYDALLLEETKDENLDSMPFSWKYKILYAGKGEDIQGEFHETI